MRRLLVACILLVAAETAALACSCLAPPSPWTPQARTFAREAVRNAVAIVDVEVLSAYDQRRGRGERVRVTRTQYGRAPDVFEIERGPMARGAACDLLLDAGQRRTVILYAAGSSTRLRPRYRIQNLCSDYLVGDRYLPITLEEARRRSA